MEEEMMNAVVETDNIPFRRPYRKIMALLILVVPFCTMIPYVAPAVFMLDIMQSFDIGLSLAGLSMTIQLGATGICMFIGSFIQDKLGIRRSIILSLWAMVAGNLLAFVAPSIFVFLLARFISGFGQGLYTVSMTPCISTWYADKERTYVITFNTAVNSIALAISYSIARPLANLVGGWQKVFILYAMVAIFVALIWTLFAKDSPEARPISKLSPSESQVKVKAQSSLIRAAKEIQYWKIMLFAATFAVANTAIASFLPTYLATERSMAPEVATTISSLNSLFGIAGSLLGGFLCAQTGRRKPIMIASLILYILVGFGLTLVHSSLLIIVLALASGTLYFVPITSQSTLMIETKEPFDPTILGGAVSISSGISMLMCVGVSFLFSAVAAVASMTVAYRVFFGLCIIGLIAILFARETGPKAKSSAI